MNEKPPRFIPKLVVDNAPKPEERDPAALSEFSKNHRRAVASIWNADQFGVREKISLAIKNGTGTSIPSDVFFEQLPSEQQELILRCIDLEESGL